MRLSGSVVVPGTAVGSLWTVAPAAGDGTLADFRRVRDELRTRFGAMGDDLGVLYEALLDDPLWESGIAEHLERGRSLTEAIRATAERGTAALAALDDPYLRARAADVTGLGGQLARALHGVDGPPQGAILAARDVSALELEGWRERLAGLVLIDISPTAHLAIVARSLGLPSIALGGERGREIERLAGERAAVLLHAFEGWLETAPPPDVVAAHPPARPRRERDAAPVRIGARTLAVYANVTIPDDAPLGASLGADGVGLVRTEFLYVDRADAPSFERERDAYARMAAPFAGKPLVVRALDLGADKRVPWLRPSGDAGMLGTRGLRLLLERPQLFANHLRAVLAGFAGSDFRLMFPMVAVPAEFERARDIVEAVASHLGEPAPELGLMLEIPAAAYALAEFAEAGARFVSLGTNDLEQYAFAADRLGTSGPEPAARAPAWRRYLRDVIARARAARLRTGVCGEAAGDPALLDVWLESEVDSLSVAPALVPWLKHELRTRTRAFAEETV